MTGKNNIILLIALFCFDLQLRSQEQNRDIRQLTESYTKFIEFMPGDSVRLGPTGALAEGWVEDLYPSGKLLHKGFYKKGKLILFKNYYENGLCERSLTSSDPLHHQVDEFFENGNVLRQTAYYNSVVKKVSEFYINAFPKTKTEFDKDGKFVVSKRTWYPNGAMESELKLIEARSKKYAEKYYYDNGHLKEEGNLVFSMESKLYRKNGTWNVYDIEGKNKRSVNFN